MTQGKPRSDVVRVMLFILAGMMIQTLYGLVDIYWVGRLGKEGVAAVARSSNLMFVALAATQMLSVGCVALVSQAAGRKEHEEVQRLFNQAQSLATWAGVLFLVAGLALHRTYAEELSGDAVTAELAGTFQRGFIPALRRFGAEAQAGLALLAASRARAQSAGALARRRVLRRRSAPRCS